jgi:putative endopeptidase
MENKAININDLDKSVNPKNNFYNYVNDTWMKNNPIPDEYGRFGSFEALNLENVKKINGLLTELSTTAQKPGTLEKQIADFYIAAMDSNNIESKGTSPLNNELAIIKSIKDKNELMAEVAKLHLYSIMPLFDISSGQDPKDSKNVIADLSQGGLGMPDRDYYTDNNRHMKELRQNYLNYIQKMLGFIGMNKDDAKMEAEAIMNIETQLAKASMTRLELRDPFTTYNKMNIEELQKISPNINWKNYFKAIGIENPGNINVMQPKFFKELSNMMNNIPISDWKIYIRWTYYNSMSTYLSNKIVNENFNFYSKDLSGIEVLKPRWKRVIDFTNEMIGMGLGKLYVDKYFPPQSKVRMLELVGNLKISLGERIKQLDWMSETTKQKALEKLSAINVKIGYPDKWLDYSKLKINDNDLFDNVLQCSKFNMDYMLSKINKPVDKTEWDMPPQTVNAYYNPNLNEICFPAGILQPPFYYQNADDAVNYGAIGVVIGHEITHGFDDQGRLYDKVGNLNDWWTKTDADSFNKRAQILINQFNSFNVTDSLKANGNLTIGENIADLGGLNISYNALSNVLKDKMKEKIDGLTSAQRFFISYAKVWAQNIRDKEKLKRTKEDVHSLGNFRVNGPLRNVSYFLDAFNVVKGDSMYLPKSERALIW